MEKKVTVIMSTFNTPKEYLIKSIDSILNQTYKNIEFIIVCDGSMEDYNIVNQYKDKRISIILHRGNKGLPNSLNEAIEKSSGDYIIRMDSDDISLKNRVKTQVDFLERHKNIDVCGMYAKTFGQKGQIMTLFLKKPEEITIQLLYRTCLVHPTVAFRKDIFKNSCIRYNQEYLCAQDFELWSKISNVYKITVIPKIGLLYRIHNKQATIEKKEIQEKYYKKTLENNVKKLKCKQKETVESVLLFLGEKKVITTENYKEIAKEIDYIVDNTNYAKKSIVKKVLYNRYFQLLLKNKIIFHNFFDVIKDKDIRKKVIKIYNFNNIIHWLFYNKNN